MCLCVCVCVCVYGEEEKDNDIPPGTSALKAAAAEMQEIPVN